MTHKEYIERREDIFAGLLEAILVGEQGHLPVARQAIDQLVLDVTATKKYNHAGCGISGSTHSERCTAQSGVHKAQRKTVEGDK